MARTLNNKDCATALGIDPGQLHRESKKPGFPCDTVAGHKCFDADEVRTWRAANVKQRSKQAPMQPPANHPAATQPAAPQSQKISRVPLARPDDPFIITLRSGTATPVDGCNASLQLLFRQIAVEAESGAIMPQTQDALKKTMGELRSSMAEYLEQSEREGKLLQREIAKAVIGANNGRLVQACNTLQNAFPMQVEMLLGDPLFLALDIESRKRHVREWCGNYLRRVRNLEAESIETALDLARSQGNEFEETAK